MSEFKKGDKVLVETRMVSPFLFEVQHCADHEIHHHPGVPVSDLLEELRLRDELFDGEYPLRADRLTIEDRVQTLREAREAAQPPKYKEGDEVLIRGRVQIFNPARGQYAVSVGGTHFQVHPDDIRKVEE